METHEKILKLLMESNPSVRFSAVCTLDGNIEWFGQRDDVRNIVPLDETKKSIRRAVKSWNSRGDIAEKAGRGRYAVAVYEKIKRITIPLDENHILLISIDNKPMSKGLEKSVDMPSIMSLVDYLTLLK